MQYMTTESGVKHNLFSLEVYSNDQVNAPIQLYVTSDRADWEAIKLSKLCPNGYVQLVLMARIKARYKNGIRLWCKDYQEFYSNLDDEQYKNTLIRDSATVEWI